MAHAARGKRPLPKWLARFNRRVTNRITRRFATHLPWFGVVEHRGRKSGREYRTPINVFAAPDGFIVALPYGADTDWVKNVLAAGGCVIETRGRRVRLTNPRLFHDASRSRMPRVVRSVLRLAGVADFMSLKTAGDE